jgi:hypothetical protein
MGPSSTRPIIVELPSCILSSYVLTSTPIYTMEVNSSFERIEKFSGRPNTISLREFKVTFLTVVCELELKYGVNYTEMFAFEITSPLCALWGIGCLQVTFSKNFGCHLRTQSSLCHNHRHRLLSYTTSYHCTSWDYAQ